MRYQTPNFPCDFEIPDDWLAACGITSFTHKGHAYCSRAEAVLVGLGEVTPPPRLRSSAKDWRGFERTRLLNVLKAIVAGEIIDPVPLIRLPEPDPSVQLPYRYVVRDGFHRFYASIIAGFSHLPANIEALDEVLERSKNLGWRK